MNAAHPLAVELAPVQVDLRCTGCWYVGRHELADVTLHHNPDDGFSLVVAECPLCGDLAAASPGQDLTPLFEAGARIARLRREP